MKGWALITGAARRLGRATAIELAGAGWDIIIHYNRSEKEARQLARTIRALGRKARLAPLDLENAGRVRRFIPALNKKYGPLAALVNNACLFVPSRLEHNGQSHKKINLDASRVLSETFRKQVPPHRAGVIVNMLDANPPEANFPAYSKSKKDLQALTLKMAVRFAPAVRVNGVAPGPVLPSPRQTPRHFRKLVAATPLKTLIAPQDVAQAVRFLVESQAITGTIIAVDGGAHLKRKKSLRTR
ncbi:MAG: SDR family oxidoreductase [Alphaproteobacteria bacterium]|nr:SDR family oxidoreductase [Alphaproteobacteria bacterium]